MVYKTCITNIMKTISLTSQEREFLTLISHATFANPFSDERVRLDLKISGLSPKTPRSRQVESVAARVTGLLDRLDKTGKNTIRLFTGEDRYLTQNAFLFEVFHQFIDSFDQLILTQIRDQDASCPVTFAKDTLQRLARRGFTQPDANRFFAMFYQLRRAYYFIDHALIGRSPSMKQLRLNLWNNVFTHDIRWYEKYLWNRMDDFSTLLLGETGTGKGAAGAAIGRSGFIPFDEEKMCFKESFMRSFIAINLSQFPEALIESELFGHRKGAFTGAIEAHEGVFARCSPHSAIFLDEIGEVSIPIQIKLLHVLQEREFSPVGSHRRQRFHGRVIAASNKSTDDLRQKKLLRDDFYYRLCSDVIVVPSLRERLREEPAELDDMLDHIIRQMIGEESAELRGLVRKGISRDLGPDYPWPGNVRELEQCTRRILLTCRYEGDHKSVAQDLRTKLTQGIETGEYTTQALLNDYCRLLYQRYGTYEEVARRSGLDRRTAKKYINFA